MTTNDVSLLVDFHAKTDRYVLTFKDYADSSISFEVTIEGNRIISVYYSPYTSDQVDDFIQRIRKRKAESDNQPCMLIQLKTRKGFSLPWEEMLEDKLYDFAEGFTILRYLPESSSLLDRPFNLPLDLLLVTDDRWEGAQMTPTEDTLRYFRTTKMKNLSGDRLSTVLSQLEFDIAHLSGRAELSGSKSAVFFPGNGEYPIIEDELKNLLLKSKTRLLLLQATDKNSFGPMLHFAHGIQHKDGPSILVIQETNEKWGINDLDDFYYSIVHNEPLYKGFTILQKRLHAVLLIAEGGSDILDITTIESALKTEYQRHVAATIEVLNNINLAQQFTPSNPASKKYRDLLKHSESLNRMLDAGFKVVNAPLDYNHESGGMLPLQEIKKINNLSVMVQKGPKNVEEVLDEIGELFES